jgi:hypothetical protein
LHNYGPRGIVAGVHMERLYPSVHSSKTFKSTQRSPMDLLYSVTTNKTFVLLPRKSPGYELSYAISISTITGYDKRYLLAD